MGSHRADIVTASGGVVEIQHSPVSPDVIAAREEFYGDQMAWIFDGTQADITVWPAPAVPDNTPCGCAIKECARRLHDELLRAVLDPAVRDNRLVVVRGGSSTGKTRAAYEAVADRLSDWPVDYPLDSGALAARLEAGIPARMVLWLGELRQYAAGGAAVLGRLADLLQGEGNLVITTIWPEQWNT